MKSGSSDAKVAELVEAFLDLKRSGGAPGAEEFVARHPDVAADLRTALKAAAAVEGAALSLREAQDLAGKTLGTYRLVREIGRGGMGVVYEAEDLDLHRRVALKVLPATALLDPRQLQRFRHEAQAAAQLHHSNIVPVHGVGSAGGVHFYAMQYIEGTDLGTVLEELRASARGTPVPSPSPSPLSSQSVKTRRFLDAVCRLGIQAAEVLDHAHQVGVVHRDIKPANLIVDAAAHLWVTDFGLAQFERASQVTRTGDLVGTFRYMSPEQALGKRAPIDHRTDVYSLGATLYELVTLEPAIQADTPQETLQTIALADPAPPRNHNPAVPAELETILLKALAKEPAERYDTAQELADDLRRFLDDRAIAARPPTIVQRARRWGRRHRALVRASAIVAMVAVAALSVSVVMIGSALARAERSLTQARGAVDRFLVEAGVADLLEEQPLPGGPRQTMLKQALGFYDEFVAHRQDAEAHATRGRILHALHRYPEALAACEEALALSPRDPRYRLAKARLLGYVRRGTEGLVLVEATIRDSPLHAKAYIVQGLLLWGLGRHEEALAACARALELDPRSAAAHVTRGSALLGLGRHEEAVAAYDRALELDPRRAVAHFNRGNALLDVGRHEEAVAAYDRALALHPRSTKAHVNRANALSDLGRHEEAVAACDRALEIDPRSAEAHANRGATLADLGRHEEALAACDRALEIDPRNAGIHFNRGNALRDLGRHEEALAAYDRALELDPRIKSAEVSRGDALRGLGRHEEVLAACDRALEIDPRSVSAHANRGVALSELGRYGEALAACDRALEIDPRSTSAHVNRGVALSGLGREEEALLAFDTALEMGLNSPDLMNRVAWSRATAPEPQLRDANRAVALAERAVEQVPAQGNFWNTLGVALCRAGRWQDAVAALDKSMHLRGGGDPYDWLFVAMAKHALGEKEEARKWFDKSVAWMEEQQPGDKELERFLAEAKQALGGDNRPQRAKD